MPGDTSTTNVNPLPNVDPSVLDQLVVQQRDVPAGFVVNLIVGGDLVVGQVTLDLCALHYPSEPLRTARRQVGVFDAQDRAVLSTEAVLYRDSAATVQAFAELRAASSKCPSGFVPSLVPGDPASKTVFHPAPDGSWPTTAGVERVAFDVVVTDDQGNSDHTVAVYLRRNAILVGIYFKQADRPPVPVGGQTTIQGVVTLIAKRLAKASTSVTV